MTATNAMNRATPASISYEALWHDVAQTLQRVTVQVVSSAGNRGAGVVWRSDGLIVTNAHVLHGPSMIRLNDGRAYRAEVVQRDRRLDLAALRIPALGIESAKMRDSRPLRTGEMVLAVGHPMGMTGTISSGIVCKAWPDGLIETDIGLAPGNSGGPLADAEGQVVGINCMIMDGMGIAISTAAIEQFLRGAQTTGEGAG
jgi:serine protease Do